MPAFRPHFDIVIIGTRRRRRHDGARARGHRRAHPRPRARRLRAAGGRRTGIRRRSGSTCAIGRRSSGSTSAASEFLPVHALQRRRQHEVLGQRALPAAARGLPGRASTRTASRRRGRSTTTRSRRTTTAPSGCTTCTASTAIDPTEPPRGPFPYRADSARARDGRASSSGCGSRACIPSPLPLGLMRPGEPGGCILCNTCNSFPCRIHAKSDAEVCCVAPALAHAERHALDERARAAPAHRPAGRGASRRSRSTATGETLRVDGAALHRLVRRRELGGAAAALGERPRIPTGLGQLVGPRRPALHGASGDDDAGVPSVPEERHGVSEDRGDQRFLSARPGHAVSARTDSVAGPHARRHGADRGAVDSALGVRRVGGARRRLAGDVGGSAGSRQSRDGRAPTAESGCTTGRTTCAPHERLVARDEAHPAAARLLDGHDALASAARNTTHQCGTLCFGTDPRTSVLDPFCRAHDVENLFVVDASFFPSSAAVNPGLTIVAQALRVADHIKDDVSL